MKIEEGIACTFLKAQGFTNIQHEPKGNRTPDFLIDKEVAVEVRRMNQYITDKNGKHPLEKLEYVLLPKLKNLFDDYSKGQHSLSSFVSIYYRRPLTVDSQLLSNIKNILDNHSKTMESHENYIINDNLSLTIAPSTLRLENQFNYFSSIDLDSGGFVISNILDSLKIIIEEKSKKIEPFLSEYKSWWLILIDFIGYGINNNELTEIKREIDKKIFDRIYFISPIDMTKGNYI